MAVKINFMSLLCIYGILFSKGMKPVKDTKYPQKKIFFSILLIESTCERESTSRGKG